MTADDDAIDVVKCMACHGTVKGPAADIQARSQHWRRFGPAWLCDDCQEDDDTGPTPRCISCGESLGYIPPDHVRATDGWFRTHSGWLCGDCRGLAHATQTKHARNSGQDCAGFQGKTAEFERFEGLNGSELYVGGVR